MNTETGFQEIIHTADLSMKVWASTMEELFLQAATGMYQLMKLNVLETSGQAVSRFHIEGIDFESLLVLFLTELLFYIEEEEIGYVKLDLTFKGTALDVCMIGAPVSGSYTEIKAVTYHELNVQETKTGYCTVIVFDV